MARSFTLKADAIRWSNQCERAADCGSLSGDPRILNRMTVGDLIKRYRDSVSPRKKCGATETIVLNAFLRTNLALLTLSEIGPAHFAAYRDERLTQVKAATINRELGPIQHAFELASREWGIPLTKNPVRAISKPTPDHSRERRLHPGEWDRLRDASRRTRNPLIWPLVELALATAMRRGELLNATWDHINLEERTLYIPTAKNGHARTIPLSTRAIQILEEMGKQARVTDQVFPLSTESAKLAWSRLILRAGIDDLHFHDLRHEAISRFFELGLSLPEVALISGHRDPRMLFRYTHLRASDIALRLHCLLEKG